MRQNTATYWHIDNAPPPVSVPGAFPELGFLLWRTVNHPWVSPIIFHRRMMMQVGIRTIRLCHKLYGYYLYDNGWRQPYPTLHESVKSWLDAHQLEKEQES